MFGRGQNLPDKKFQKAWTKLDTDGSGVIDFIELLVWWRTQKKADKKSFETLLQDEAAAGQAGAASAAGLASLGGAAGGGDAPPAEDEMRLQVLWGVIDRDGSGFLDDDEVMLLFSAMGKTLNTKKLGRAFLQMDSDGSVNAPLCAALRRAVFTPLSLLDCAARHSNHSVCSEASPPACGPWATQGEIEFSELLVWWRKQKKKAQVEPRPAAALPMDNSYCGCELTQECAGPARVEVECRAGRGGAAAAGNLGHRRQRRLRFSRSGGGAAGAGPPQHGLPFNKMALITSDGGTMRSPSTIWP